MALKFGDANPLWLCLRLSWKDSAIRASQANSLPREVAHRAVRRTNRENFKLKIKDRAQFDPYSPTGESSMKKCWFQVVLCPAIVGFICCQQALAQAQVQPKFTVHHIRLARHARAGHVRSEFTAQPAPGFYPIYAGAGIMPNQDNLTNPPTDMWPCDPYNYVSQYCQETLDIDWPVGWTAQGYGGGLWSGSAILDPVAGRSD